MSLAAVERGIDPALVADLRAASAHHRARSEHRVNGLIGEAQHWYLAEIHAFLNEQLGVPALRGVLGHLPAAARPYLEWLRWTSWNICELAAVAHAETAPVAERLGLATAAYAAGRLIDDALDGHDDYKGRFPTLLGVLREQHAELSDSVLRVHAALLGFGLLQHALRRLRQRGHLASADAIDRLSAVASTGVLAESLVGECADPETYREVIRRKSVAYNMILYKPALEGVESAARATLLRALAAMDELSQLLNDLTDRSDDQGRRQMNAFAAGAASPTASALAERVDALWASCAGLDPVLRQAFAAMLVNLGIFTAAGPRREHDPEQGHVPAPPDVAGWVYSCGTRSGFPSGAQ
ncbi:MAG TPA: class 1 isoprenoid biosynthesis enzyme [Longimicrobiaceae bacterium]|nr:class 1 isoprenoid biosynthesis enzyme [Longimicrobiaceae bacterium]